VRNQKSHLLDVKNHPHSSRFAGRDMQSFGSGIHPRILRFTRIEKWKCMHVMRKWNLKFCGCEQKELKEKEEASPTNQESYKARDLTPT